MISTLNSIIGGLDRAVSRATQATGAVVKASSTGQNGDDALLALHASGVTVAALAADLKITQKNNHALLDIKV